MFVALPKESRKKLLPHQDKAIAFAIAHLNQPTSTCLIRMPTGTGKTGVVACLTRLAHQQSSLVLTPWANLRRQMIKALDRRAKVAPLVQSTSRPPIESCTRQIMYSPCAG